MWSFHLSIREFFGIFPLCKSCRIQIPLPYKAFSHPLAWMWCLSGSMHSYYSALQCVLYVSSFPFRFTSYKKSIGTLGWRRAVKANWNWRLPWWRLCRRTSFPPKSSSTRMSYEPWIPWGALKTRRSSNKNSFNRFIIQVSLCYTGLDYLFGYPCPKKPK